MLVWYRLQGERTWSATHSQLFAWLPVFRKIWKAISVNWNNLRQLNGYKNINRYFQINPVACSDARLSTCANDTPLHPLLNLIQKHVIIDHYFEHSMSLRLITIVR